jgi:integrase
MKLTAKRVARYAKQPGRHRHHDGHGLYLQILSPTNASWQLRYERNGRERWLGLGPTHTVGLKEARERAKAARLKLLDGLDPIDEKRAAKASRALEAAKALTFEQAARQYYDGHSAKWKSGRHSSQFLNSLKNYAFPIIGKLAVSIIDTGLILKVLEPHWHRAPETLSRVRARIENVLDWATVRGYRTGDNPARWRGHLKEVLPARNRIRKTQHFRALPHAELPQFMTALRAQDGVAAKALEFLILTATRSGEVRGAKWSEIDLTDATWTIPANRMKGGKEHRVPLAPRIVAILRGLYTMQCNEYVFVGTHGVLGDLVLTRTLRRLGYDATAHGFRSSFRDWAAERTSYPHHVIEQALAHNVGSAVERSYLRSDLLDQRRKLMDAWARYCTSPAESSAEIVTLRGTRQ